MGRPAHVLVAPVLALAVLLGPALTVTTAPTTAGAATAASRGVSQTTPQTASRAPDRYSPQTGVKFNDPYGRRGRRPAAIRNHIVRSINSTVRGSKIRMVSWNIRGRAYTDALIGAHRRGVSVRVIMDFGNANGTPEGKNADVSRLIQGLRNPPKRRPGMRSWVKRCKSSCRGTRGIPHSKFYLFDKAGRSEWVTMYGSSNATDIAAKDQWNDLYTIANHEGVYAAFNEVFTEMARDRAVRGGGYRKAEFPRGTFHFYPYVGKEPRRVGDPDLARLRHINCTGATGGAGVNGRTKIRMAQDALLGARGKAIARRLITMRKRGCDIRIVYSLMGKEIRRMLTGGGVRMLQYSYDRNRDGVYDIYLHMKAMAVSGVYRGKTDARLVFNGTANWSPVALASDEVVGEIWGRGITAQYMGWTDYLFSHRPRSWGPDNLADVETTDSTGRRVPVDPYALMRQEGF